MESESFEDTLKDKASLNTLYLYTVLVQQKFRLFYHYNKVTKEP
jgi:hypothetical protein